MRLTILPMLGLLAGAPAELATTYPVGQTLRIEAESLFSMETTEREILRDGEPVEGRGGGREEGPSVDWRRAVWTDQVLEAADDQPTKVRREFETIEVGREEGEANPDRESPLAELIVEIEVDEDGEVAVEVVEGDEPGGDQLASVLPTLALDALLPDGDVEPGTEWEPEIDDLRRALWLDLTRNLFPRPERAGGGGRGRGRDRAFQRGGGGMRGNRGAGSNHFRDAEWSIGAKLAEETEDVDGTECVVIELAMEAEGEIEMPEGRGRQREFAAGPAAASDNGFEIEVEGRLLFDPAARRPVSLTLEGELTVRTHIERGNEERSMEITIVREGTYTHTTTIAAVE